MLATTPDGTNEQQPQPEHKAKVGDGEPQSIRWLEVNLREVQEDDGCNAICEDQKTGDAKHTIQTLFVFGLFGAWQGNGQFNGEGRCGLGQ